MGAYRASGASGATGYLLWVAGCAFALSPGEGRRIGATAGKEVGLRIGKQERGYDSMKKRIVLLLTVTAVMMAMVALSVGTAFAQTTTTGPVCEKVGSVITCVTTTTVTTETTETTTVAGPPIVTNLDNTFVATPTTGPCTVGNSGRAGTAEGISTQEFENISTQQTEITVTNTFETTTTSVKTETFKGNTKKDPETSETVTSPPVKVLTGTTTSDPEAVGDPVMTSTPIGDPVFTATGKCKNVSGPQPQARG